MFFGPEILAAKAALILASVSPQAQQCSVAAAPAIKIDIKTDEIVYDYSKSAAELSGVKSDTVMPGALAKADSVTGGLREDKPEVKTEINWDVSYDRRSNVGCMWYKTIVVTLHLKPRIYLAREFNQSPCREEVLNHERKHVEVDRYVMNRYGAAIGKSVQDAVNSAGALGPFNMDDIEKMRHLSSRHIDAAIESQSLNMRNEMRRLQAQVDTAEEYKRVSGFCKNVKIPGR